MIEQRRETHRALDRRHSPVADEPTPSDGGFLPFKVGPPAFTRELRQVQ
jgi:hypothetical protein